MNRIAIVPEFDRIWFDIHLEKCVLGSLLIDTSRHVECFAITAGDFSDPLHSRIFGALHDQSKSSERKISPVTIYASLKGDPGLAEVGGLQYLADLIDIADHQSNFEIRSAAAALAEFSIKRRIIAIGADLADVAISPSVSSTAIIHGAVQALKQLADTQIALDGGGLEIIDVRQWHGISPPPRKWIVAGRIPSRTVTLLSGDGGSGKSTLAVQLMTASALGQDWLGASTMKGPTLGIFCEDDKDELHLRFERSATFYGSSFLDLDVHPVTWVGKDTVIAKVDRDGIMQPTRLFWDICAAATRIRPTLVVIDHLAKVFAGNENDRSQVQQFLNFLYYIALEADCAVVLLNHPSLVGISTGTGTSGNTGWHNGVRSRLYFYEPKKSDVEPEDGARILEVKKSNYGPKGEKVELVWSNGLYVPANSANAVAGRINTSPVDELFLQLLDRFEEQGRPVSDGRTSTNNAAKVMAETPEAQEAKVGVRALKAAMERLFAAKRIHVVETGKRSRPQKVVRRCP